MSNLDIDSIVQFWANHQEKDGLGRWTHEKDSAALQTAEKFGFNLAYPVSPYIGDIINAPVIILNLNGGFNDRETPKEFAEVGAAQQWLERVAKPHVADWSGIPKYYHAANYGAGILDGRFVAINACAYRSFRLQDSKARALASSLPSVKFHQRWLREAVAPLADSGKRLVIAHRWGLWKIPSSFDEKNGIHRDLRCRAFADIDANLLSLAQNFVKEE